jgi:apolipoprotein N-acyltransferase
MNTNEPSENRNLTRRLTWLWLLIGALLLPFTAIQTVIPLAAWLAPIFLLRFERTALRPRLALLLIYLTNAMAILIELRGSDTSNLTLFFIFFIIFIVLKGLLLTLPYILDHQVGSRLTPWARLFVFPMAFTVVEWLMSLTRVYNTTGSVAYSQYSNLVLMQILSITGMGGITFLIMWCASTVNLLWEHNFDWRPVRSQVAVFTIVLVAGLLFGSARLVFAVPSAQTVEAATITKDSALASQVDSYISLDMGKWTDMQRAAIAPKIEQSFVQMLARSETALKGGARLISWEEGGGTIMEEDEQKILDQTAALAKQYNAYIQVSFAIITHSQQQQFLRNQSILVDPTGVVRWTYDKAYPVFITETYYTFIGTGKLPIIDTSYGRLSTAICNDLHFTPLILQAGQNDVDLLLAPYHDIHPYEVEDAVVATYRAVENGFSLVRPTGKGISTIVDYQGRILATQNYFTNKDGIMMTTVPVKGVITIYSRIGNLFTYLCVAGLVFLIAWALLRRNHTVTVEEKLSR